MESLEHNCGNISLTICTNMLIFSKDTFLVLFARMISINPLSSQIFIFVTSHFATLLSHNHLIDESAFFSEKLINTSYFPNFSKTIA